MAVSAAQQRTRLAFDQSRRTPPAEPLANRPKPEVRGDRGAAVRLAQSLATGERNKNASLDRQVAGEVGARVGQAAGAYFGGVGAPIGKRIGRVAGENWRIIAFIVFLQVAMPILLIIASLLLVTSVVSSIFS